MTAQYEQRETVARVERWLNLGAGSDPNGVPSWTELSEDIRVLIDAVRAADKFTADIMDMAGAYKFGSPESRAIITALEHAQALASQQNRETVARELRG